MTHGWFNFTEQANQQDHIKKSIMPHLLNAVKALIPKFWKQKTIPTLRQWLVEVDYIYHMEKSTLILRNKTDLANKIWSCWFAFKFSTAYAEIMHQ